MEVGGEAERTGMTVPIESLLNLGPKSGQWLVRLGLPRWPFHFVYGSGHANPNRNPH